MACAIQIVQEQGGAEALLNPTRRRILELLRVPASASGISEALGMPRQMANYHLKELEKAELVHFVEERKKGNCMERFFRASAESYIVAPAAVGELMADPDRVQDRGSRDYMVALGARLIQEVGSLVGESNPTLALEGTVGFATDEERLGFAQDLTQAISQVVAKYHRAEGAQRFRMLLALHPQPSKENS